MKKLFFILIILTFVSLNAISDSDNSLNNVRGIDLGPNRIKTSSSNHREYPVPNYSISIPPEEIMTSFYDYSPGSYASNPIRAYMPDGELEHIYMVFHQTTTITSERYISYAYIDNTGNLTYDRVSGNSFKEGYPGINIDYATGDPLVTYHHDANSDGTWHVAFTYDLNHFIGGAGYWADPVTVINNDTNPVAVNESDEFIWPYTYISRSPISDDHRRVYIFTKNLGDSAGNSNDDNACYAFADFTTGDLESLTPLNWSIYLVPQMDTYVNEQGHRPYHVVNVDKNGNICIFGYFHPGEEITDEEPETFILYNNNYGNIDNWQELIYNAEMYVDPPLDQDGTNDFLIDPYFTNYFSSHLSSAFDPDGKYHWLSNYTVMGDDTESGDGVYIKHRSYLKKLSYDPVTNEVTYADLYPKGVDPYDNNPYLPWDEDENGEVDSFSDEGEALSQLGWPIYYHVAEVEAWGETNFKLSYNEDTGWMAAVWQDGVKNAMIAEYDNDEYNNWAGVPEICIAMSYDHGSTWTDPIFLNSIDNPELAGIIPEYVYPCDKLVPIDENTMRLYLMFFDDNDFGSFIRFNTLPNTGGRISYMAVDIDFTDIEPVEEPIDIPAKKLVMKSYPNPFNISSGTRAVSTIKINLPEASYGKLEIFNLKGQIIKTLASGYFKEGENTLTWNGKNNENQKVSSGIYFYKISTDKYNSISKTLLIK